MPFHDSLYRLRTGQKLSQAKLAERIGVTAQSVQKWESGAAVPELDKMMTTAEIGRTASSASRSFSPSFSRSF